MASAEGQARWRKKHPWAKHLESARKRCRQPSHEMFYAYGGRGIKCDLTQEQVRQMWVRDGAENMIKPTLDRIDSDGHYTFGNCRFLPRLKNLRCPRPISQRQIYPDVPEGS